MATFAELSQTERNEHHKNIFGILARHENGLTQDAPKEIILDSAELESIKDEMSEIVSDARQNVQSLDEMKKNLMIKIPKRIENVRLTEDGYFNSVSGVGTDIDPAMSTESLTPVSILPQEATAYYANGGIPSRIIDKKSGCLSLDGVHFECSEFSADDLTRLDDYANSCGFSEAYTQGITQALIFGGAVTYPILDDDNPINFLDSLKKIKERTFGKKDFIRHWVTADRWNCVFVPDYNITAKDYLYAKSLFIPLGGVRVSTQRMAMIRPKKLPFWGSIQQMGWSTSDFEGWIKDFESYQIMKMSLPIMAQQSSLMYHAMPADGLIIENGAEFAKQYFKENEQQMREWSILHPRAINSIGEIKILERTYSGYRDLLDESRLALCASSGVAESILFEEKATGLASDNREDVTLKQSEMIRLLFNNVAPSFQHCIDLLVCSCFGADSEQAKHASKVRIKADNGFVLSETEKIDMGLKFSQMIQTLNSVGIPLKESIELAKTFAPSADISAETMRALTDADDSEITADIWEMLQANRGIEK
jgi:hypothetical protein